jgi:hypothetical protein
LTAGTASDAATAGSYQATGTSRLPCAAGAAAEADENDIVRGVRE